MRTARWLRFPLPLITSALGATACGDDAVSPARPNSLVPPAVAEDPALPAIEMNGSRCHVETRGDPSRPVIVVLHGGPGGDYRSLLRLSDWFDGYSLVDDYFLVYWDQRGTGLSERVDKAELTIDTYVTDLDTLVNRYAPGRQVFLMGESWGGMFATRYINEFPNRGCGRGAHRAAAARRRDHGASQSADVRARPTIRLAQRPGMGEPSSVC